MGLIALEIKVFDGNVPEIGFTVTPAFEGKIELHESEMSDDGIQMASILSAVLLHPSLLLLSKKLNSLILG